MRKVSTVGTMTQDMIVVLAQMSMKLVFGARISLLNVLGVRMDSSFKKVISVRLFARIANTGLEES